MQKLKTFIRENKTISLIVVLLLIAIVISFLKNGYISEEKIPLDKNYSDDTSNYEIGTVTDLGTTKIKENNAAVKVTLKRNYEEDEHITTEQLIKERDEQVETILKENQLTAYDLENYKESISADVMKKIEEVLEVYNKKINNLEELRGEDGKDGKDGEDGETIVGPQGPKGDPGKAGVGVAGKDGKDGKDGAAGKSTYIAFADDINGNGFSRSMTDTSKYMASLTTDKEEKSLTAADFAGKWKIFKDRVITYDGIVNGKPQITIH